MARPDTASILKKGLFYVIMMTSVVLEEDKSIQAPFNEVRNWAQKVSDQTLRAFFNEHHVKCIAILTRGIAAWANKLKDGNIANVGVAPLNHVGGS